MRNAYILVGKPQWKTPYVGLEVDEVIPCEINKSVKIKF
jgi:hypothetical protein